MKQIPLILLSCLFLSLSGCVELFAGGAGSGGTGPIKSDGGTASPTNPSASKEVSILDSSVRQQSCGGFSRKMSLSTSIVDDVTHVIFIASVTNTSENALTDTRPSCASFTLTNAAGAEQAITSTATCDEVTGDFLESYRPDQQVDYLVNWQPNDTGIYRLTFNHEALDDTGQTCPNIFLDIDVK